MVAPIMMMMMSRASDVRNVGIMWALEIIRFSVKTLKLSQCSPLPVSPHSFYSLLIYERMVSKALARGLLYERCWMEVWEDLPSALSLHYLG